MITKQQLMQAIRCSDANADKYLPFINETCIVFEINTSYRQAAFLAQIAHESAALTAVVENLNYGVQGLLKTFPKYFNYATALVNARKPDKIANIVYANRMGNTIPTDGYKYRGRGLIQLTGKANYTFLSRELFKRKLIPSELTLVMSPDLLATPRFACMSAGWFWYTRELNELADKKDLNSFKQIGRAINGGTNGETDRIVCWAHAKQALGLA